MSTQLFSRLSIGSLFVFKYEQDYLAFLKNKGLKPERSNLPYLGVFEKTGEKSYRLHSVLENFTKKRPKAAGYTTPSAEVIPV